MLGKLSLVKETTTQIANVLHSLGVVNTKNANALHSVSICLSTRGKYMY